jgi:hypothetical protein
MGDAADAYTENGVEELAIHARGECEDMGCPYCYEPPPRRKRKGPKVRGAPPETPT